MSRNIYLETHTPEKARELWFARIGETVSPPGTEKIPLAASLGRVVANPVAARISSPAFHGAAMDGIAVEAAKTYTASPTSPLRLEIGRDAFWINTGRPLPPGTNAVIMVEHVNIEDDGRAAVVEKAAFPWQHVRKTGEDMVATEIILAPGAKIGPYELGAMAASGVTFVEVYKKPKVAIIPSGSEIRPMAGTKPEDITTGKYLPEFNSIILSALVNEAGGEAAVLPIAPDDPALIAEAVRKAVMDGADLVILNAGASAGSHDFSAQVIGGLGELTLHGVAMMPGKPTALGLVINDCKAIPILGAPGYPVSAIMAVEEFALPLLARWRNQTAAVAPLVDVFPCNPLPSRPGMEERIRVKLGIVNGAYQAIPLPRGAGTVSSLARADAIITVPANCEGIGAGEAVKARLLRPAGEIAGALLAIGSHDNTLDLLDSLLRKLYPAFRLTSAHVGSMGGLLALARKQCHLAGSHLLDPETGIYNQAAIRRHLSGLPVALVRLVNREQGFMFKPGNPCAIRGIEDLARKDVRFINRQNGSGTRVLLDYELQKRGIAKKEITGYQDEEYTHMNVAAAVLSGRADVGLGVAAAANALGLEFLPFASEEYDLVIPAAHMEDERIVALLEVIRSAAFRDAAQNLGGYDLSRSGDIIWEYDGK